MSCDHDATDLEVAILADGLCPLCLAADNATLRAELEEAKAALAAAEWALAKVFKFVPEMFKKGWTDEVQASIDRALRDVK